MCSYCLTIQLFKCLTLYLTSLGMVIINLVSRIYCFRFLSLFIKHFDSFSCFGTFTPSRRKAIITIFRLLKKIATYSNCTYISKQILEQSKKWKTEVTIAQYANRNRHCHVTILNIYIYIGLSAYKFSKRTETYNH